MTKKIGFIDLFIDEWHANHYPEWIRGGKLGKEFELGYAWEEKTKPGLRPLDKWCADFGMTPANSQEEVIENSDCLIVLAPSNPEVHEELSRKALMSGKPTYMDKPFAPDKAAALRIFELARKHKTPMFSSSALRFCDELIELKKGMFKSEPIRMVGTLGGGSSYWEYCIHQIEMIVALMGTGAKRLMQTVDGISKHVVIEYGDGRIAHVSYHPNFGFQLAVSGNENSVITSAGNHCFETLLDSMMEFFNGGQNPVPEAETIEIASLVGQSVAAQTKPNVWFEV